MDEALIPHARRLRIRRRNFRLLLDISSKESTLQLVYDVMRLTPFFKAFQVEHKDTKKSNEMYYPRDDHMFTTIKLVSRHQNIQQFGAMLPIELTNADIRNSAAYKEYYAVTTGATPPKTKASVRKTKSSFDTTVTPHLTAAAGPRLSTFEKGKQAAKASKAKSLTALFEVAMTEAQHLKLATKKACNKHISLKQVVLKSTDEEGDDNDDDEGDNGDDGEEDDDGEEGDDDDDDGEEGNDDDDDDAQDDDDQEDEGNNEDDEEEGSDDEKASDEEEFIHPSLSTHAEEETKDEESFDPIPKTPENTNDEGNGIKSIFETTSQMDVQTPISVAPLPVSAPTLTPSTIATITRTQQASTPPTTAPSTLLQDLPNFGSLFGFDHRLKTLEANFSEFMQTNQFAGAVSSIPEIVQRYMDQRMNEPVKVVVQI
nr:hypothetical protein [Tanacetum cinerariifolium]